MFDHVDFDYLANMVVMLRAGADGAIWVPEDDDEATFYQRCSHKDAIFIPAHKDAIPLIKMLEQTGIQGLVGTVRGLGQPTAANIFRPKLGDVASLLLASSVSEDVIRDITGNSWFKACQRKVGPICHRAAWIARIFHHLERSIPQPRFRIADPDWMSDFVDWHTFAPDWAKLTPWMTDCGVPVPSLHEAQEIVPTKELSLELAECDGMDAMRVISSAIQKFRPMGIASSRRVTPAQLCGMLRVAFELCELEKDEMFWRMREWERANPRYPLLRQWRALDSLGVVWDQRYWESDLLIMTSLLKPNEPFAMFQIDLDHFKDVNDTLGHAEGDQAIRLYCGIVKRVTGPNGEVYRRGGDEIVLLAPGLQEQYACDLAELLRTEIEIGLRKWAAERGLEQKLTASIGLAVDSGGKTAREISRLADEAQHAAKRQGKNCVVKVS